MSRFRAIFLFLIGTAFIGLPLRSWALKQVSGVNLTADEGFGARQQGMGLLRAGFQDGADAVINAPASMNDVNDFTFSTTHQEQFGGVAHFDCAAFLLPWHEKGTLGLAIATYGVTNTIENHPYVNIPDSVTGLFGTADWMIAGSLARRYGNFDVGGTVDILYRNLGDQSGLGLRADAMAQYTFSGQYRTGVFVRGIVPSSAKYQSGWTEYELPDASVFASGNWESPYFYGSLQAGFETPVLLEKGSRSSLDTLNGKQAITDPVSLLKTSKLGAEFRFNFGLCVRAGLNELDPSAGAISLGAGYGWHHIVGIDYAFTSHPSLSQNHRLALWWTPSFSHFEGRNFRPKSKRVKPVVHAVEEEEEQPSEEKTLEVPKVQDEKNKLQPDSTEPKPKPVKSKEKEVLEDD